MNIVAKYVLNHNKTIQQIRLPKPSRILSVIAQHDNICIYVEEPPAAKMWLRSDCKHFKSVEFAVFMDNRSVYVEDYQFLGTVALDSGNKIYHVFYRDI